MSTLDLHCRYLGLENIYCKIDEHDAKDVTVSPLVVGVEAGRLRYLKKSTECFEKNSERNGLSRVKLCDSGDGRHILLFPANEQIDSNH